MLSAAKHLGVGRERPFAALRVTRWGQGDKGAGVTGVHLLLSSINLEKNHEAQTSHHSSRRRSLGTGVWNLPGFWVACGSQLLVTAQVCVTAIAGTSRIDVSA